MKTLPCNRQFPASRLEIGLFCLRPFAISDAPEVLQAITDSTQELRQFMPWSHIPTDLESQVKRLRAGLTIQAQGEDFSFGLFEGDQMLAGCGLHFRVPLNPNGAEIGFWTRTSHSGRGLATLLTQALIVYAIEALAMDRISITHNLDNPRSQRVVEKVGFLFEGIGRNELGALDPEAVKNGLSPCRDVKRYALLPHQARALAWYPDIAAKLRAYDQIGNDLGFLWKSERPQ